MYLQTSARFLKDTPDMAFDHIVWMLTSNREQPGTSRSKMDDTFSTSSEMELPPVVKDICLHQSRFASLLHVAN